LFRFERLVILLCRGAVRQGSNAFPSGRQWRGTVRGEVSDAFLSGYLAENENDPHGVNVYPSARARRMRGRSGGDAPPDERVDPPTS
jgi:hypothetical protein